MEATATTGIRWNVCVDGSDAAREAFNTVFNQLMKECDHITVSHVFSSSKDYLSFKYKPENIKQDYEAELIATSNSVWTIMIEHLNVGLTTKEHLMKITEKDNSDIIVMGYIGRKGPKEDPTLLGSAVEYMAQNPLCPALVVKRLEKREDKESGGFKFLVCCDHSEKSYKALESTIKIMDKEKDSITVLVIIHLGFDYSVIQNKTDSIFSDQNVANHTFVKVSKESDEDVNTTICDYINLDSTEYVDFVSISNQGSGSQKDDSKNKLGKVAKGVLCQSQANVLLCL